MFNLLNFAMYRSMSFELKCAVNSVALKLMLACQHGGVNRMGQVTAGALYETNPSVIIFYFIFFTHFKSRYDQVVLQGVF